MDETAGDRASECDELLTLLADADRRRVIGYFLESTDDVASVEDLAVAMDGPSDRHRLRLHHAVLPRLAEAGVVEYDGRSETVRYHGSEDLERLAETLRGAEPVEF